MIHHVEHGVGVPLVALHGAGVDHRETEAAVEAICPRSGFRRIYPDLPAMGRSTADGLTGNDGVVTALLEFVDLLDAGPVLLLGHSYGAYLARGIAARRPALVRGIALLCPLADVTGPVPEHRVSRDDGDWHDELDAEQRAAFEAYFVVRTVATVRRYRDHIHPGTALVDQAALERIFAGPEIDLGSAVLPVPTLIVAGRHDAIVGSADAVGLLEQYPGATLAVLDGAGHALIHERPDLLAPLLADWLERSGHG